MGKQESELLAMVDRDRCVCIHPSQPDMHTHSKHDFGMWRSAADGAGFMAPSCIATCGSKSGQRNFLVPVIMEIFYSTVPVELFICIIISTTEETERYTSIMERDGLASGIHPTEDVIMQLQIHVPGHWRKGAQRPSQLPGHKTRLAQ